MLISHKGMQVDVAALASADFRKSTRSGPNCDNCVEVAFVGDTIAVRDSKNTEGPVLLFTTAEWDAFVDGAKEGEFNRPTV
ncbi:DUF397 domain-containing protein [Actinoplanes subglobosus]|uniref:DUF397 domain-containing protein n=1 Tax=Actinoplanes subglobosus TaxID=1547892 RepID=A0ABV8J782_9ACTN